MFNSVNFETAWTRFDQITRMTKILPSDNFCRAALEFEVDFIAGIITSMASHAI